MRGRVCLHGQHPCSCVLFASLTYWDSWAWHAAGLCNRPVSRFRHAAQAAACTRKSQLCPGRTLLNLDTEDWGELFIGCAGGGDTQITLPCPFEPAPQGLSTMRLAISGLVTHLHLPQCHAAPAGHRALRMAQQLVRCVTHTGAGCQTWQSVSGASTAGQRFVLLIATGRRSCLGLCSCMPGCSA